MGSNSEIITDTNILYRHIDKIVTPQIRSIIQNEFGNASLFCESESAQSQLRNYVHALRKSPHAFLENGVWVKSDRDGQPVAIYDPGSAHTRIIPLEMLCGKEKDDGIQLPDVFRMAGFKGYVLIDKVDLPDLDYFCFGIPNVFVFDSTMQNSIGLFSRAGTAGLLYVSDLTLEDAASAFGSSALGGKAILEQVHVNKGVNSFSGMGCLGGYVRFSKVSVHRDDDCPFSDLGKSRSTILMNDVQIDKADESLLNNAGLGDGCLYIKGDIDFPVLKSLGNMGGHSKIKIANTGDSGFSVITLARSGVKIISAYAEVDRVEGRLTQNHSELYCVSLNGYSFGRDFLRQKELLKGIGVYQISEKALEAVKGIPLIEDKFSFLESIARR